MKRKVIAIFFIMLFLSFTLVSSFSNATNTITNEQNSTTDTDSSTNTNSTDTTTDNEQVETSDSEILEYLQGLLDILPTEMNIDLKESEYEKSQEIVETKIIEIWTESGIDMQDLEKKGISYSITTTSYLVTTMEEFYKSYIYLNYSDQYLYKSIELIYNNHSEYNPNDETYIKNLSITSPKYYEVDLNFLPYQGENWETAYNNFFNMIGSYYNEQIGNNSILVKATSGAGGTDGGLNLWTWESGTFIGIFKNDILYDIRILGNECSIPVITIPSTVTENEINNYITNAIKQYYPEFAEQITSIEKGTKGLEIDVPNGYTIYSNYTEIESYIIARTVNEIQLEDTSTGIKLQTTTEELSSNVKLSTEKVTNETTLNVVKNTMNEISSNYVVYDITLLEEDVKVQPNGKVKISIPVPEGLDKSKLSIYRISDNGEKTEYNVTLETIDNVNYATFETDHFSTYVLAETVIPSQDNQQEKDNTVAEGILPNAGVGISIITFLVAVVGISVITYNKYSKMKDIKTLCQ